ncbi:S5A_REDUCTASE domain-containing protein [Durusdinium trenchii]|uniref:S5A_REDUCTASE domain-containing protein n=1 Tax=Durusdinium trenchii TaxID=1381693 RepID=A0ABP0RBF8_9DINO
MLFLLSLPVEAHPCVPCSDDDSTRSYEELSDMSVPEPGCYVAQAMEGIAESTASSKEGDFHGGASNEGINNEVPNTNAKDVREEVIEAIDDAINFMEAKDAEEPAPTSHAVNAMQAPNNTDGIKVTLVNSVPQPALGILDLLGLSMWCVGFLTEAVADGQKFAFRGKAENRKKFIKSGLWRFSRHPNYFGEILMWLGLCTSFMSCVTSGSQLLVWISPAFNALLLLRVSGVPMLEKAGEEKWGSDPEYQHYMKNTSCIVPWFPASEYKGPKAPKST